MKILSRMLSRKIDPQDGVDMEDEVARDALDDAGQVQGARKRSMMALTEELIAESRPATLFVTHSRSEAERLSDRILTLAGTPASLT